MKVKQVFLVVVIVIVVFAGVYFWSAKNNLDKLKLSIEGIQLAKKIDLTANINLIQNIKQIDVNIKISIQNFSSRAFTVSQLYIEVFDENEQVILGQIIEPLKVVKLSPGSNSIEVKARLYTTKIIKYLFGDKQNPLQVIEGLTEIITGFGTLERKIRVKGFVKLRGSLITKKINEIISI